MELRQLKYFVTAAEELNFRRAAEKLYMEQPPLSRQIRNLEQELGVELFERTKRGVILTSAGAAFLEEARRTLAQAETAVKAAQRANKNQPTTLKVGFSICIYNRFLPQIIQQFRQKYPQVEVCLQEMATSAQVQALMDNEIDVGFLHLPIHEEAIATQVIVRDEILAVLPENHPLASRPKISLYSLANEPFILFPRQVKPDFHNQIFSICKQGGFTPKVIQEATPPEVAISFVAAGMGVSFVTAIHSDKQAHGSSYGGVVFRAIEEYIPPLEIALAWLSANTTDITHEFIGVAQNLGECS